MTDPDPPSTVFGSYGYNAFGTDANGLDELTGAWVRENDVVKPSDMIEFGDANISIHHHLGISGVKVVGLSSMRFNYPEPDSSEFGLMIRKVIKERHRGKLNMVFADGHVEHGRTDRFHGNVERSKRWRRDNLTD